MSDNRLNQLEITLAHHEQQIQDLSDIVTHQQQDIDRLVKRLNQTQNKLKEVEAGANMPDSNLSATDIAAMEKPPHY